MKKINTDKKIKIVYEEVEVIEFDSEKEAEFDDYQRKGRFSVKEEKYVN